MSDNDSIPTTTSKGDPAEAKLAPTLVGIITTFTKQLEDKLPVVKISKTIAIDRENGKYAIRMTTPEGYEYLSMEVDRKALLSLMTREFIKGAIKGDLTGITDIRSMGFIRKIKETEAAVHLNQIQSFTTEEELIRYIYEEFFQFSEDFFLNFIHRIDNREEHICAPANYPLTNPCHLPIRCNWKAPEGTYDPLNRDNLTECHYLSLPNYPKEDCSATDIVIVEDYLKTIPCRKEWLQAWLVCSIDPEATVPAIFCYSDTSGDGKSLLGVLVSGLWRNNDQQHTVLFKNPFSGGNFRDTFGCNPVAFQDEQMEDFDIDNFKEEIISDQHFVNKKKVQAYHCYGKLRYIFAVNSDDDKLKHIININVANQNAIAGRMVFIDYSGVVANLMAFKTKYRIGTGSRDITNALQGAFNRYVYRYLPTIKDKLITDAWAGIDGNSANRCAIPTNDIGKSLINTSSAQYNEYVSGFIQLMLGKLKITNSYNNSFYTAENGFIRLKVNDGIIEVIPSDEFSSIMVARFRNYKYGSLKSFLLQRSLCSKTSKLCKVGLSSARALLIDAKYLVDFCNKNDIIIDPEASTVYRSSTTINPKEVADCLMNTITGGITL